MKKLFLLFLFICSLSYGTAQNPAIVKPDYKKIESAVADRNSTSYYPVLLERYAKSDTTLTKEDFRMLYYGSLFQSTYSPYGHSDYNDSIRPILAKVSLSAKDYYALIKYEKLVLDKFPFNIRDLNILDFAYEHKGKSDLVNQTAFKLENVIETILSTGDGRTEETAWHVISVEHEYDIVNMFGLEFGGQQSLTTKGCDYLQVKQNKDDIKGFYFDVNKILEAERKTFEK
jgi:hypothetical protein